MNTNFAVLIDADNIAATHIKEMMEEINTKTRPILP